MSVHSFRCYLKFSLPISMYPCAGVLSCGSGHCWSLRGTSQCWWEEWRILLCTFSMHLDAPLHADVCARMPAYTRTQIHTTLTFDVFSTVHHSIGLFLQPTSMHNSCMSHYYPRHVLGLDMPILRRDNCTNTASGILALELSEWSYINLLAPEFGI